METQAWLIRPKPHDQVRIKEFLEDNFVAVGWPNIGNLSGLREYELRERIQERYGESNSALATLKIMVYRMKIGDYIVVPYEGSIYFGKIVSDYYFDLEKDNDTLGYPHQRKVTWYDIVLSREELPDDLKKSTRVVRTAADLTPHVETIAQLVNEQLIREEQVYSMMEQPIFHMSEAYYMDKGKSDDDEELVIKAKQILEEELEHKDPLVRLRAAEIILNTLKHNEK